LGRGANEQLSLPVNGNG